MSRRLLSTRERLKTQERVYTGVFQRVDTKRRQEGLRKALSGHLYVLVVGLSSGVKYKIDKNLCHVSRGRPIPGRSLPRPYHRPAPAALPSSAARLLVELLLPSHHNPGSWAVQPFAPPSAQ